MVFYKRWNYTNISMTKRLLSICVKNKTKATCHYEVLSIPRTASQKDIREAFLKKTKQCHPDKNPLDKTLHSKFVKVTQAYEVLRDEQSKNLYDRVSHPNVVHQHRTRRNSTSAANPFGTYEETSEWQWDPETKQRMYEEFYKTYADHEKQLKQDREERTKKNMYLLLLLFSFAACLGVLNFSRIIFYHHGYRKHVNRMTEENAALLKDGRSGYKSLLLKIQSNQDDENG